MCIRDRPWAITYAVVAILVVLSPGAGEVDSGVPVKVGEANGAFNARSATSPVTLLSEIADETKFVPLPISTLPLAAAFWILNPVRQLTMPSTVQGAPPAPTFTPPVVNR